MAVLYYYCFVGEIIPELKDVLVFLLFGVCLFFVSCHCCKKAMLVLAPLC